MPKKAKEKEDIPLMSGGQGMIEESERYQSQVVGPDSNDQDVEDGRL